MRIVVNDIAASTGGAMTVLRDFYTCVCKNDRENQWIFLLNDRYFEETDNVKIVTLPQVKQSHLRKLWFDFVAGRKFIQRLEPDVVFSLQNIITFGIRVPQVVYIHQSIPFQTIKNFSFWKKEERSLAVIQHLIGRIIKRSAKKSDQVIVQTQWMKDAVCRQCDLPESKVHTSLPTVKPVSFVEREDTFDQTAFFYPTADEIYKNNDCVRKASEILTAKGVAHAVTLTLPPEQSDGKIRCVGRLPHEEVMAHYRHSTLVFPSYIETFGYPLAEARLAGTIVLASDTPFSREVLGGYENAYFFDPFQPEQLAVLMEQIATGKIEKKPVQQQVEQDTDSWELVIDQLLSLCQQERAKKAI